MDVKTNLERVLTAIGYDIFGVYSKIGYSEELNTNSKSIVSAINEMYAMLNKKENINLVQAPDLEIIGISNRKYVATIGVDEISSSDRFLNFNIRIPNLLQGELLIKPKYNVQCLVGEIINVTLPEPNETYVLDYQCSVDMQPDVLYDKCQFMIDITLPVAVNQNILEHQTVNLNVIAPTKDRLLNSFNDDLSLKKRLRDLSNYDEETSVINKTILLSFVRDHKSNNLYTSMVVVNKGDLELIKPKHVAFDYTKTSIIKKENQPAFIVWDNELRLFDKATFSIDGSSSFKDFKVIDGLFLTESNHQTPDLSQFSDFPITFGENFTFEFVDNRPEDWVGFLFTKSYPNGYAYGIGYNKQEYSLDYSYYDGYVLSLPDNKYQFGSGTGYDSSSLDQKWAVAFRDVGNSEQVLFCFLENGVINMQYIPTGTLRTVVNEYWGRSN